MTTRRLWFQATGCRGRAKGVNEREDCKTVVGSRYHSYASGNVDKWRRLVGLRVKHSLFNEYGVVSEFIQTDFGSIFVWIHFENPVGEDMKNDLKLSESIFASHITELKLPIELFGEVENHETNLRKIHKQNVTVSVITKEEISRRHQQHMQEYGISYSGEKESDKLLRYTHCWKCKKDINNIEFLECATCGWIICQCGACGCGYSGTI